LRAAILVDGFDDGLRAAMLVDGFHDGLRATIISTALTTVCVTQCSSNGASDRSSVSLVDGYPNGLPAAMLVEWRVGSLVASARRISSVSAPELSLNSASDRSSVPLVDGYPIGLRVAIVVELLVVFHISCASRQLSHRLADAIGRRYE